MSFFPALRGVREGQPPEPGSVENHLSGGIVHSILCPGPGGYAEESMKPVYTFLGALVCVGAGLARWLDLNNFTEYPSGFPTQGPYWVRYLVLGAVLFLLWVMGQAARPRSLPQPRPRLGCALLSFGAGAGLCMTAAQYLNTNKVLDWVLPGLAGIWLAPLGVYWLGLSYRALIPVPLGIAGTLYFLYKSFLHGLTYAANLHRIGVVWEALAYLAALWFLVKLLRLVYLPGEPGLAGCYTAGMWAFFLDSCIIFPQGVWTFLSGGGTMTGLLELFWLGLVGLLGLGCAFSIREG